MERANKKRLGIIATIVLVLLILGAAIFAANAVNNNKKTQSTLQRVLNAKQINWGVKIDTKLFGLLNTKTNEPEGFDVDIAKAITQQIAKDNNTTLKATFTPVNSSSRIQLLKNTYIDGVVATMTITQSRAKIVDFSNSYFSAGQSLLVKDGSPIQSVSDLDNSKYTVLSVVGSSSIDNMKKYAPNAKTLGLQDYAQAMNALKAGQGDALTTDNGILYGLATENKGYHVINQTFTNEPYGMAFDKNQPEMVAATNKALNEIIQDGTYNQLIEKWFSSVPGFDWRTLER